MDIFKKNFQITFTLNKSKRIFLELILKLLLPDVATGKIKLPSNGELCLLADYYFIPFTWQFYITGQNISQILNIINSDKIFQMMWGEK